MKRTRWWLIAVLGAGLAVYVAVGLSRITLDVDVSRLLPPNVPETTAYRLLMENFSRRDELIVALEGSDPEKVEACAKELAPRLESHSGIVQSVRWQAPWENRVESMTEWVAWALLNQPPEVLEGIERKLAPGEIERTLERSIEQLATSLTGEERLMGYDPFGLTERLLGEARKLNPEASEFTSADGTFRVLYVRAATRPRNYRETSDWLARIRGVAESVADPHGVTVRFTGEPAFLAEISNGMETDMKVSATLTLILSGLMVWLSFRSLRVVPALILTILVVFVLTLASSGVLLGSLTVLSVGFGAILIGLSADYGILLYQSARRPGITPAEAVRRTRRGIFWAAVTTAASFFGLIPSGMPGLAELGLLVGLGVLIGLGVFIVLFPKLLVFFGALRGRDAAPLPRWFDRPAFGRPAAVVVSLLMLGLLGGVVVRGLPRMNASEGSMRPRRSESYTTFEKFADKLTGGRGALSILVAGRDVSEVGRKLRALEDRLDREREAGRVVRFALPTMVWPDAATQRANIEGPARRLAADQTRLHAALETAGFSEAGSQLTESVLDFWRQWDSAETEFPILPSGESARELLRRFVRLDSTSSRLRPAEADAHRCLALGFVILRGHDADAAVRDLQADGIYLAGRRLLNRTIEHFMSTGFMKLALIFGAATFGLLVFALRNWRALAVTAVSLCLGFAALLGAMSWLGLSWNAFTLPALLISLGTGSDYFIYVALDLEQRRGDVAGMRGELGQALIACASVSTIGFASLGLATTTGLANMGIVCALALAINMSIAIFLTPWGWRWIMSRRRSAVDPIPVRADA